MIADWLMLWAIGIALFAAGLPWLPNRSFPWRVWGGIAAGSMLVMTAIVVGAIAMVKRLGVFGIVLLLVGCAAALPGAVSLTTDQDRHLAEVQVLADLLARAAGIELIPVRAADLSAHGFSMMYTTSPRQILMNPRGLRAEFSHFWRSILAHEIAHDAAGHRPGATVGPEIEANLLAVKLLMRTFSVSEQRAVEEVLQPILIGYAQRRNPAGHDACEEIRAILVAYPAHVELAPADCRP